ncbi:MAG: RagB/SusD family nutrient uptake outer membrane protein, partial [Prevotella sp.]|nr:RagB/SusD family nutrient uptake outer membrane protein [Prevotella sp.]
MEDPKSYLSEENAYADAKSLYVNTVATLYNYIGGNKDSQGLQGTSRGVWDYNTLTTDEAMTPTRGGDWYDGGYWENLYLHKWTEDDNELYETWKYLYKVVMLCNYSLASLDKYSHLLTDKQLQEYKAEVRGVRALFYYYLLDLFGRVPIVVDSNISVNDVKQNKRSEVFKFVVDELQSIMMQLHDVHSNYVGAYYGRMTSSVVFFLLAKLALNAPIYMDDNWTDGIALDGKDIDFPINQFHMNAYEATVVYCEMLSASGYRLSYIYEDNFSVFNESSRENIFTIPMDKTIFSNIFDNVARSCHYNHGSALGFGAQNGFAATVSTVKTFGYRTKDVDPRYYMNFYSDTIRVDGVPVRLDDGGLLAYYPLEIKLDVSGSPYEKTAGARMYKYQNDETKAQRNDIVLFRFADALLMKAEAFYRNGKDGLAFLNEVRERVGASPIKSFDDYISPVTGKKATVKGQCILDERLRELVWEGWRRQDLIRFGLFHQAYD